MSGTIQETITLSALASFSGDGAPQFSLLLDGQSIGSGRIGDNSAETTSFSAAFTAGQAHTVSIVYLNHTSSAQMLNVQSITLNGRTISSADPGERYVSANGTYTSWGQMYFGGQIDFALPASLFPAPASVPPPVSTAVPVPVTVPAPVPVAVPLPVAVPAPITASVPSPLLSLHPIGAGADSLVLSVSEDAYLGDAQFTISVDGVQQGGAFTTSASHAAGQTQTLTIAGAFAMGAHTVTVNFLNDAYGGAAGLDRNLFVSGATLNGTAIAGSALDEYSGGPQSFTFRQAVPAPTPVASPPPAPVPVPVNVPVPEPVPAPVSVPVPVLIPASSPPPTIISTLGSGPDSLVLMVSEDAYAGDAQFIVMIDGTQLGGTQTATTSHAAGALQALTIAGDFGATTHTVTVTFLNDAYGGTVTTDRNLYVEGATLNGRAINGARLIEYSNGAQSFLFTGGTASPIPITAPSPPPTPAPVPAPPPTAAFYVGPQGSNAGDGSIVHPFATLQYAVGKMETAFIKALYVEAGTYATRSKIVLTSVDSGDSILAAPGAAPVLDGGGVAGTILSLEGAQNITIAGLTFQNANADPSGAALSLSGSNGDTVSGNRFLNNAEGVLVTGSSHLDFSHNELDNSASSAVEIKDASNYDAFTNNVINGVGGTNVSGAGFYGHGINNNLFQNNLIENTAGAGIGIEDFGQDFTLNSNNTITQNKIINTSTSPISTDDGAIYLLGRSDTDQHTTISQNFIGNAGNVNPGAHVEGIYLDDNTSGISVTGNIVQGVQSDAVELHGGYNDHFTGNIFDLGTTTRTAALIQQPEVDRPSFLVPGLSNDSFSGNIIVSQQDNPYYTYVYFDPEAVNVPISNNLYWDAKIPAGGLPDTYGVYFYANTPAGLLPTISPVADSHPLVGDPKFAGGGSYALGSSSAAALISFTAIDQTRIGPQ